MTSDNENDLKPLPISREAIAQSLINLIKSKKVLGHKIPNQLHFERMVDLLDEHNQSICFESFEEMFDTASINRMILARGYNWTRPVGVTKIEGLDARLWKTYKEALEDKKDES